MDEIEGSMIILDNSDITVFLSVFSDFLLLTDIEELLVSVIFEFSGCDDINFYYN